MKDRNKTWFAILIVFLALLLIGFIESIVFAKSEEIKIEINKSLKYRDGIVLLWEEPKGVLQVFGNEKLKEQKFLLGSIMKLFTAQAALEQGINPSYQCQGHVQLGKKIDYCWTAKGHGHLDLAQALAKSCNLYFSRLGELLGWEAMLKVTAEYDIIPPKQRHRLRDFAIGESPEFRLSPLKVSQFWRQYLKKLPQRKFQAVFQGLQRTASEGTASGLKIQKASMLAKTGTADSLLTAYPTHGWLVGAFPAEKPRYAFVIFLKNAHGYGAPVALANRILALLNN